MGEGLGGTETRGVFWQGWECGGVGCQSVFWRLLGVFGEKGHFEVALVRCALLLR